MDEKIVNWAKYGEDNTNVTWHLQTISEAHSDIYYIQLGINLAGIAGNVLVIIAHFMGGFFMVSVNVFVLALACSDLLAAILLLPLPAFSTMPNNTLGWIYCVFYGQETLFWICIKASIFFIMTIALESAAAVRSPHLYKKVYCNKRYRRMIVALVWTVSLFSNIHHYFTDCVTVDGQCVGILDSDAKVTCDYGPTNMRGNGTGDHLVDRTKAILISLYVYCVSYILPFVVMVMAYALTAERLRRNMKKSNGRNPIFARARHRIIGVVMIDIIVFFVCVTPNEIIWLLQAFNKDPGWELAEYVKIIDGILLSVYVCANPIIYTATNPQFRLIMRRLSRRPFRKNNQTLHMNDSRQITSDGKRSRSVQESST